MILRDALRPDNGGVSVSDYLRRSADAFGEQLLGPFSIALVPDSHPLRLSETPLEYLLFPITACNMT